MRLLKQVHDETLRVCCPPAKDEATLDCLILQSQQQSAVKTGSVSRNAISRQWFTPFGCTIIAFNPALFRRLTLPPCPEVQTLLG